MFHTLQNELMDFDDDQEDSLKRNVDRLTPLAADLTSALDDDGLSSLIGIASKEYKK